MSDFVEAVVRATGRKQRIPGHWLNHPTIGPQFRLTARAQAVAVAPPQVKPKAKTARSKKD